MFNRYLQRTDMHDVSFIIDPESRTNENDEPGETRRDEHDVSIVTIFDLQHEKSDGVRSHTHDEVATSLKIIIIETREKK